jgi:hypothetical protein
MIKEDMIRIDRNRISHVIIFNLLIFLAFLFFISSSLGYEGEDDMGDISRNLGWIALGLFSVALVYVFLYQLFIKSRKHVSKNKKPDERGDKIKKIYMKVKKPLSYLHYFATIIAVTILPLHGIPFLGNESEKLIPGLMAGIIYLIYVSMGFFIKVVFRKPKKGMMKVRKFLFTTHTHLILLSIIGIITIVHIVISA